MNNKLVEYIYPIFSSSISELYTTISEFEPTTTQIVVAGLSISVVTMILSPLIYKWYSKKKKIVFDDNMDTFIEEVISYKNENEGIDSSILENTEVIKAPLLRNKEMQVLLEKIELKNEKFNLELLKTVKNPFDYLLKIYLNSRYQEVLIVERIEWLNINQDYVKTIISERKFFFGSNTRVINLEIYSIIKTNFNEELQIQEVRSYIAKKSLDIWEKAYLKYNGSEFNPSFISVDAVNKATEAWRKSYPKIYSKKIKDLILENLSLNLENLSKRVSSYTLKDEITDIYSIIQRVEELSIKFSDSTNLHYLNLVINSYHKGQDVSFHITTAYNSLVKIYNLSTALRTTTENVIESTNFQEHVEDGLNIRGILERDIESVSDLVVNGAVLNST